MRKMDVGDTSQARRIDCTPPHWKTEGLKVEFTRRRSSSKLDIVITTPPPESRKIRSLKAFASFIAENKITSLSVEDLNSRRQRILWKKRSLEGICQCVVPKESPLSTAVGHARDGDHSEESSSSHRVDGEDGVVEDLCATDKLEESQIIESVSLGSKPDFEISPASPCSIVTHTEGKSWECSSGQEALGARINLCTKESLVKNAAGDDENMCVDRLSAGSGNVLGEGAFMSACTSGSCSEELEECKSWPSLGGRLCSEGILVCVLTPADGTAESVNAGGEWESQTLDAVGPRSLESTQGVRRRQRRRRGPCVSPYFRKSMATVGAEASLLPPCIPRKGRWLPPRSPFGLVQEDLYHDPFQLLVATILLNKTRGDVAVPVIWKLLGKWPTAETVLTAPEEDIASIIQPLGLQKKRAFIIKKFAGEFLNKRWKYPDELYGIGKYGTDSYRIFCVDEWQDTRPTDHMLLKYVRWLADKQQI